MVRPKANPAARRSVIAASPEQRKTTYGALSGHENGPRSRRMRLRAHLEVLAFRFFGGIFFFSAESSLFRTNTRRKNASTPSSRALSISGVGLQLRCAAALPASVHVFSSSSSSWLIMPACWSAVIFCTNGAVSNAPFNTKARSNAARVPIVAKARKPALAAAYTSSRMLRNSVSLIFQSQSGFGRGTGKGQCVMLGRKYSSYSPVRGSTRSSISSQKNSSRWKYTVSQPRQRST